MNIIATYAQTRSIYIQLSEYANVLCKTLILASILVWRPAAALELIMIEQAGCHFCERFNAEIAPAYAKTTEGQQAPLRRIDLNDDWPEDLSNIKKEPFTPTFVLVDNNKELARIRGYPGDEHFWFLLNQMLESAKSQ